MRIEIDMNKIDLGKDFEHESCLNELLDLNNSFDMYYVDDNDIIYLDDGEQLLNAYDYITDIFYLESEIFNINSLDTLSKCVEII
ncbi:hypothetical protein Biyabedamokiny1_00058 [Staphylococcus phage Biyabeda-mokiny_1]|nr:hypothetical protein Biyabedamokiny1_00058 [Staphylococcus phage Biyabeda-mokiny_1]